MFTAWLRKVTHKIIAPIAAALARLGVPANTITILGSVFTIIVALLIALGHLRLGGVLLIGAASIDALDGAVARQMGRATKFGAFLDSVLDRVSESAVLLGLAWWYMGQPGQIEEILAYVAIVGSMLVSYARARGEGIGVDCEVGLFTRVERAILIIAALILGLTTPALWVLAVGTTITAIHRIVHVYLQVKDMPLVNH